MNNLEDLRVRIDVYRENLLPVLQDALEEAGVLTLRGEFYPGHAGRDSYAGKVLQGGRWFALHCLGKGPGRGLLRMTPCPAPEEGTPFAELAKRHPAATRFHPGYCDDVSYCE